jgi:hypothetical protein
VGNLLVRVGRSLLSKNDFDIPIEISEPVNKSFDKKAGSKHKNFVR